MKYEAFRKESIEVRVRIGDWTATQVMDRAELSCGPANGDVGDGLLHLFERVRGDILSKMEADGFLVIEDADGPV